ncbi:MAG: hypothetical protein ACFCD0_09570 [Gemmataceae bacterium]
MRTIYSLGTVAFLSALMLGLPSESKAQFGLSVRFNVGRDYDRGRAFRPVPVRDVYRRGPVVVQPRRTVVVRDRQPVYVAPRGYRYGPPRRSCFSPPHRNYYYGPRGY